MSRQPRKTHLLSDWLERLLAAMAQRSYAHPWHTFTVVAIVTTLAVLGAMKLRVDADAAGLLPESFPSVQAIEQVKARLGTAGYITVVGSNASPEQLKAFADDIAPKLEALPDISYVQKDRPVQFIEDHALYFLDPKDLRTFTNRVEERVDWELRKHNPMFIDLDEDDDDTPPPLKVDDLGNKYAQRSNRAWLKRQGTQRYYLNEKSKLIVLMAKPSSKASDLNYAKRIIEQVQGLLSEQDLKRYGPNFRVALSGRYKKRVDQQRMVSNDLRITSLVALALMLLYLILHFRRLQAVLLVVTPLLVGLSWMFGYAYWQFGTLNILSGFVGAILLGMGIDHGIHLLGRYEVERNHHSVHDAIRTTFGATGRAAVIAALTSAAAFVGIATSQFRGFHEFGVIAGSGMLFVLLAYTVLLPAMLGVLERIGWRMRSRPQNDSRQPHSPYARGARRWSPVLAWLSLVGTFFLIIQARSESFDYDFSSLNATNLPSVQLDKKVNQVLGYSQTPLVVLAKNKTQEREIADQIRAEQARRGEQSTIDMVVSVSDIIPDQQQEKREILNKLSATLRRIKPSWLKPKDRKAYQKLVRMAHAEPFDRKQLPIQLRRMFENPENQGEDGFVQVFSRVSLSDGRQVRRLAAELRSVKMPDGTPIAVAGEGMILADILNMVWSEGPPVMAFTAFLVFFIMWLLLGSLRQSLAALSVAMAGLGITLGLMSLAGVKLNYLNLIFLLVLLGVGVDASVHLITGWGDGHRFEQVLEHTGRSIAGATLTTMLGFGSLILAHHPGLQSVGEMTILGMLANLLASLVMLVGWTGVLKLMSNRPVALGVGGITATVGGAGFSPVGPGTLGAVAAFPIAWAIRPLPVWAEVAVVVLITLLGTVATKRYLPQSSAKDPQEVVVDEVAGALITMVIMPMTAGWQLAAFGAFRLFDIWKPWPVGWIDKRIGGATGVMADDVVAGLMGGAALWLLRWAAGL